MAKWGLLLDWTGSWEIVDLHHLSNVPNQMSHFWANIVVLWGADSSFNARCDHPFKNTQILFD